MRINDDTQLGVVLAHLQEYGSITSMEAIMEYGITRLAVWISRLKVRGYRITSVTEQGVNRFGRKVRYSRYCLETDHE